MACTQEDAQALLYLLDRTEGEGALWGYAFHAEIDEQGLWISDDGEAIDADWIAQCIHEWLVARNADDVIGFEVAYTCSKPRVGEFGGAVYVCTKSEWNALGTGEVLRRCEADPKEVARYFNHQFAVPDPQAHAQHEQP